MTAPVYYSSAPAGPPRRSRGAGRIVALVIGALLLVPGLGLLLGGGMLLWADWTGRSDGFVVSPDEVFTSQGYALVSERIDLQTDADWLPISAALGTTRVEVTGPGQDEVFVGIAPVVDATAYLGDVQRTVIDDLGFDQPGSRADERPGGAPSGPPTEQDIWTAQTAGAGTQQLSWEPAEGDWMLVVMNADGSSGVSIDARIGATVPALGGLAWGVLGTGVFLLLIGTLLLVLAVRRPRVEVVGPPRTGVYSGSPPPWTPPAPVDRSTAADARPDTTSSTPPGGSTPG